MSISQEALFSWEGIVAHQRAEERVELLDTLHGALGSLTLEQLMQVQNLMNEIRTAEVSDG